jgi:hypothetical protein
LDDIRARKIDVIVVYKVDRLTRSLADFAKLVELFDTHGVSFVSVTQQFNTTTSRLRSAAALLIVRSATFRLLGPRWRSPAKPVSPRNSHWLYWAMGYICPAMLCGAVDIGSAWLSIKAA